jgi:hypothetical protein
MTSCEIEETEPETACAVVVRSGPPLPGTVRVDGS